MSVVMGLDPSTTSTGVILLEPGPKVASYYLVKPKAKLSRYEKQLHIMERVETIVREHSPDLIVIEGYGMNLKNPGAIIPLVELGGVLRFMIHSMEVPMVSPQPVLWKQFLLGPKKGMAKKDEIAAHIKSAYGVEYGTDDLSDAFALALMGLGHRGELRGLTQFQCDKLGGLDMV